ncbi:Alpha/Beta hydrolase protein [Cadophora sp. MPI-SDFR-AT-0126]|nr:Alpha/Beta hydrolase protein [Leotiomycetes sp. MPI-SDFR-AT-0126]
MSFRPETVATGDFFCFCLLRKQRHPLLPLRQLFSQDRHIRRPYASSLILAVEDSKATLPEALNLEELRKILEVFSLEQVPKARPDLEHTEPSALGLEKGDPTVTLSVFKSKNSSNTERPALYSVHGGGQIAGTRFTAIDTMMSYFVGVDTVFVAPEYRLAPNCIDPARIIVEGGSGGAPIACGTAMMCCKNNNPFPLALMLLTPMLDDRDCTNSAEQFACTGPWCGTSNRMAWDMVLGSKRGGPEVSELVAPARATDLYGMPQTFIDAGDCEVFRDEAVAFASQLWKCGVQCELHVWPGAYHGFDALSFYTLLSQDAINAKKAWVRRVLTS